MPVYRTRRKVSWTMFECFEIFLVRKHWDTVILCISMYFSNYVSSLPRYFLMIAFSAIREVCYFLPFLM